MSNNIKYLEEYDNGSFSDHFISSSHKSFYQLFSQLAVETSLIAKKINSLNINNYRSSLHLQHAFQLFLVDQNTNILSQTATAIRNKYAKRLLNEILSLDIANQICNVHHCNINLKNGHLIQDLQIVLLEDILFSHNPLQHKKLVMFRDYLDYKTLYSKKVEEDFLKLLAHITQGGNAEIVLNHPTYFTPGIIVSTLEYLNKKHDIGIDNINERMYIIIGPSPMTIKPQGMLTLGLANALKTHTKTTNGIINTIRIEQERATDNFVKKTISIAKESRNSSQGKIFLICPTGTKDTINRTSEYQNKIYMGDDNGEGLKQSLRFINILSGATETLIMFAGVNESQLKNPSFVNITNNDRNKGVYIPINTRIISAENYGELYKNKKVMDALASLVQDQQGNSIAKAVDAETLHIIKKGYK